ncbi:adenylosuccinate lyase [Candidatus Mycoplasma pogonae]
MIKRYEVTEISQIWSDENKYKTWLKIEIFLLEYLTKCNLLSEEELQAIKAEIQFSLKNILKLEKSLKHDVFAFINDISNSVNATAKKWIHYGLTSTDLVDTANAYLIKQTNDFLESKILNLMITLQNLAFQYKDVAQIGRTHGIHAEITSFGLKFAIFYNDMEKNLERFRLARKQLEVGKISGAVGTYANTGLELQDYICQKLGVNSAEISTQILSRDSHAFYFNVLNLMGLSINKITTELRHLARTEVNEVNEYFSKEQVGSSAMPHKKNPISWENISGLSRLLQGYAITANENVALWHERDISHSSNERILFLDATTILAYITNRLTNSLQTMIVNSDSINYNINLTSNSIFSQTLMLKLINKIDLSRQQIYQIIKEASHIATANKTSFKSEILKSEISKYLSESEINDVFDAKYHLKYVDEIYKKVFK